MADGRDAEFFRLQQALAGRYSLDKELGRGGMGIVFLAREVSLDRPVALKLLPPRLAAQPATRERFLREARTAARLSHPNIVQVLSVDEVDDFVFIAMAYIEGESLGQRIRTRGPRPPSEVTRILREVVWALGYAHAQGVVHRDVKPDNILLESANGRALVADFGIASVVESTEREDAERISGTAEFMSPEQALGKAVGPACDMYSLGVVGYYALSGRLPFEGSTPAVILAKHISESPPPLASIAEGVPGKLARAIERCLAKDPADRYSSDEELAEALGLALPERRELPVPLRLFVKREGRLGAGGALLYLWVLAMAASLAGSLAPAGLETVSGFGTFFAGLTLVPAGIVINRARRLLKSGYGPEEMSIAFKGEVERAREEGAFEFGEKPSLYERIVRGISGVGLGVAALSTIGLVTFPGPIPEALWLTLACSLTVGAGTGLLAFLRLQRRRGIDAQLRSWLWRSRLGDLAFAIAGLGLKSVPDSAATTYRPTELAIGMAADRLFEGLPRELRRSLSDLPDVVRRLEGDAQKMRLRIDALNETLAEVTNIEPSSQSLAAAPQPSGSQRVGRQREGLKHELLAARDATQQRLADSVAALERIRLSLLRLQGGTGSVAGLTEDLAAARHVASNMDEILAAQREVESLLTDETRRSRR
jgi:serine/threonine-protein kinase